jgi:8-oxo-dGTP pyrophosphatase MutT (NUDIX family)
MKWLVSGSRTVYACPWFSVDLDDVTLPDGRGFEHHVIRVRTHVAGVVVTDADDRVLLLYRHRFITDRWGWEIPAGAAEAGEDLAAAALRELAEETGFVCATATLLTRFATSNGLTDQEFFLFRASRPLSQRPVLSKEESTTIQWHTRTELETMLANGEIHDGATMLAVLCHLRATR